MIIRPKATKAQTDRADTAGAGTITRTKSANLSKTGRTKAPDMTAKPDKTVGARSAAVAAKLALACRFENF